MKVTPEEHIAACKRARRVWRTHFGEIPKGFHVHHINHDPTDNRPENLELLSAKDHAHHHRPPNPIPREERPERVEWVKAYNKRRDRLEAAKLRMRRWRAEHPELSRQRVKEYQKRRRAAGWTRSRKQKDAADAPTSTEVSVTVGERDLLMRD